MLKRPLKRYNRMEKCLINLVCDLHQDTSTRSPLLSLRTPGCFFMEGNAQVKPFNTIQSIFLSIPHF
jgi:hypothetical protein